MIKEMCSQIAKTCQSSDVKKMTPRTKDRNDKYRCTSLATVHEVSNGGISTFYRCARFPGRPLSV